jgi:WD40 repeat protein
MRLFLLFTLLVFAAMQNWGEAKAKLAPTVLPEGAPDIEWAQMGHSSRVISVPFSPDAQLLASGGGGQVKLWRVTDGALARAIKLVYGSANSVAFSPDGQTLAVGTSALNNNLSFFRVADGELLRTVSAHYNGTTGVAFTPDGALLVSGGRDRTVKIWRASDGALINTFDQGIRVLSIAVSPDGQVAAAGSGNGEIKLWRIADGAPLGSLTGHTDYVLSLAFSANGAMLASGGADDSVRVWAIPTRSLIHTITIPNSGTATSIAFSRDGQTVVAGTSELLTSPDGSVESLGALRFWRVSDGALLLTYDQQTSITVNSVALSPDGGLLSYGRQDGGVVVARSPF